MSYEHDQPPAPQLGPLPPRTPEVRAAESLSAAPRTVNRPYQERSAAAPSAPEHRPVISSILLVAAGAALASLFWYVLPGDGQRADQQAVPLVRAETSPVKIQPDDRGGMEIPHRDSTIFETLRPAAAPAEGAVENLLDTAEEPVSKDVLAGAPASEEDMTDGPVVVEEAPRKNAVPPMPALPLASASKSDVGATGTVPAAPVLPAPAPVVASAQPSVSAPVTASPPVVSSPAPRAPSPAPVAASASRSGDSYVQLASVQSESGAETEWPRIQARHAVLAGVGHRVQKADLGAKGTYYRLQGGPVSKAEAERICGAIKASGASCMVVGR